MSIKTKVSCFTTLLVIGASAAHAKGPDYFQTSDYCYSYAKALCGGKPSGKAAQSYWEECMFTYVRQCGPSTAGPITAPMLHDRGGSGSGTEPSRPATGITWEIDPGKLSGVTMTEPEAPIPRTSTVGNVRTPSVTKFRR